MYQDVGLRSHVYIPTTSTSVCECWTSKCMDDRRIHSTHCERQEQRDNYGKLQTIFLPFTGVETVDKYILLKQFE